MPTTSGFGSFTTEQVKKLHDILTKAGANDFDEKRWGDAKKRLATIKGPSVNGWLGGGDAQVSPSQPGTGTMEAPKGIAVIDCRCIPPNSAYTEVPWAIKKNFYLGAEPNKANKKVFDDTIISLRKAGLTEKPALQVVFYDSHGLMRAPEMAIRYIDHLLQNNLSELLKKQLVYFMDGGMEAYKDVTGASTYLEVWPPAKPKPKG